MLANRLANRFRHVSKWARRQGITCFRLYERDIPDFPMIVDWYDGDAVAWFYHRTKDDTLEREVAYRKLAEQEILTGLEISRERLFIKYRARQRDGSGGRDQYERFDSRGAVRVVEEFGLKFEVNLSDYLDTGLFLDHRFTRKMVRERSTGKRMLNLFSYTGAFTVHARAGGAIATTTVDMSKTYLAWAERNLALNGFSLGPDHHLVHTDCLEHLARGPEVGESYDIIVCDPPTFSNSKRMRADSFAIDRDWPALLTWLERWLAPGGVLFFSTNSRGLEFLPDQVPASLHSREITSQTVPEDFRNERIHRCWRIEHKRVTGAVAAGAGEAS
ncbi:MAG: class I SAM-dependent methyltransferase [Phycisphaerae bacterium]|nr:class I SAM-dependent methyltransferase [Phycisphaerae bacterium]